MSEVRIHRRHVFLTGERQTGKSTLCSALIDALGPISVTGFRTVTAADRPGLTGCVYIIGAEVPTPAFSDENRVGLRLGGGRGMLGYPEIFDREGLRLLREGEAAQLILMDEIGRMEENAQIFTARVLELLDGDTPILGVLRQEGDTPLQRSIRCHHDVQMAEVTAENRTGLLAPLLAHFRALTEGRG